MWNKPRASVFPRTYSEEESSTVVVGEAPPSFEDVLSGASSEKPFDLDTFCHYAARHFFSEGMMFLAEVREIRAESNVAKFKASLKHILEEFIYNNSPSQVNLSDHDRRKTERLSGAVLERLSKDPLVEPDRTTLDTAYDSILTLIKHDHYRKYADHILVQRQLRVSRLEALWWTKEGMTLREFFTFPSPVNAAESRLHAVLTTFLVVAAMALTKLEGIPHLWLYITYGFFARCLCGPRIDPQAFFVLFFMRPFVVDRLGLLRDDFVPGSPKRFAQGVGLVFAATATMLAFMKMHLEMLVVSACLLTAAILWGFCNCCFVCIIYMWFVEANVIPTSMCADCRVRYIKGQEHTVRVKSTNSDRVRERLKSKSCGDSDLSNSSSRSTIHSITENFSSSGEPGSRGSGSGYALANTRPNSLCSRTNGSMGPDMGAACATVALRAQSFGSSSTLDETRSGRLSRPRSAGARFALSGAENIFPQDPPERKSRSERFSKSCLTPMGRRNSRKAAEVEEYNNVFSRLHSRDLYGGGKAFSAQPMSRHTSRTYSSRTFSSRTISDLDVEPAAVVSMNDWSLSL